MYANSGEPDQTPHYAASDLDLYCLHMSHKKDARLIWVNKCTLATSLTVQILFVNVGL